MNPTIKIIRADNWRRWRMKATALVVMAAGGSLLAPSLPVAAQTGYRFGRVADSCLPVFAFPHLAATARTKQTANDHLNHPRLGQQQRDRNDNPQTSGSGTANMMPRAVLLFPAVMGGDEGGDGSGAAGGTKASSGNSMRPLQDAVTDALRKYLVRSGVSVTVYNKRLPSIQRAVAETALPKMQADEGLRDSTDNARAQKLADLVGATSYIIPTIDDYKYDAATRTATFNLSASHIATGGKGSLGVAAEPGKAEAPADVANALQEGSASARAAEAAAERVVVGLFPRPAAPAEPAKKNDRRRGGRRASLNAVPVRFVIARPAPAAASGD